MPESSTHIGPYKLDRRINTRRSCCLCCPKGVGTRIPFDAAVYCLTIRIDNLKIVLHRMIFKCSRTYIIGLSQSHTTLRTTVRLCREWIEGASLREMLVMIHQSKALLPQDTIYDIVAEIVEGYASSATDTLTDAWKINQDHVLLGVDGRISIIGLGRITIQTSFPFPHLKGHRNLL